MAGFRERDKHYFPLKCVEDVVDLFEGQLDNNKEPDLTLLSIVIGAVEACLTINRTVNKTGNETANCAASFPAIKLETIEALYQRFAVHVKGSVDLTKYNGKYATRDLVKKVSDVIWNSLARSYHKDKAHLQSIYSFLTGSKLDCFGVALATVAGCQQLGCDDVHLALSEDHAWVVYGEGGKENIEVTWHGKGLEDRRGLSITRGLEDKSWLYLNGHPVVCDRYIEAASIVSGINPAINSSMDSVEMARLQQKLLWLLYERRHLDKYPLALGNLGDLEEVCPSDREVTPLELFHQATASARDHYNNMHVYPYTYLGSHHYRRGKYREAIQNWAYAGSVISQYNHNREDEEVYKEFLEIANEYIPNIVKASSDELHRAHLIPPESTPLLQDPSCYSHILQMYDGICQWEEGSSTPVLHAVWAQHLVHTLSKFDEDARINIDIERDENDEEDDSDADSNNGSEIQPKWKLRHESTAERLAARRNSVTDKDKLRKGSVEKDVGTETSVEFPVKRGRGRPPKRSLVTKNNNNVKTNGILESQCVETLPPITNGDSISDTALIRTEDDLIGSENGSPPQDTNEEQIKSAIEELVSRVGNVVQEESPNPKLAALAQACGDSILNPEYLIAGGEPFTDPEELFKDVTDDPEELLCCKESNAKHNRNSDFLTGDEGSNPLAKDHDTDMSEEAQIVPENNNHIPSPDISTPPPPLDDAVHHDDGDSKSVHLSLQSAKLRGLKGILVARKLNANAIKLQVTAQSQVHLKHSVSGVSNVGLPRKRLRRE